MLANAPLPDVAYPTPADEARVYEPAEDSYLLMDVLLAEAPRLREAAPAVCLEVGSGSGCVTASLFRSLALPVPALHLCTDVNPRAAATTRATALRNGVRHADVVRTDLTGALHARLRERVDVLIFNPPYVPTPADEVGTERIEAAWAGGALGREVIDRFLPLAPQLLAPRGSLYLLLEAANRPAEVEVALRALGLGVEEAGARRARNERLCVLRAWRL